ncbi:MAG: FHA domain-containing protein [Anaerolineae bacterium]|nr:FHA domain-containing protein [Anaerolineae bacterium]
MMSNYGRLILITSDGTEQVFPLTVSELTLGRDESNDIVLVDPKVSRLHARLECSDQGCVLIDVGSGNGTFVEEERIERVTLQSGCLIRLGRSNLRFEAASPANRPKRARAGTSDRQLLHQFLDEIAQGPETTGPTGQPDFLRDRLLRVPHLVIHTPTQTWVHRLQAQDSWSLGRSEDNDIVLDHAKVSRHHARIERDGAAFIIRDLGSANGTFLGRQQIEGHTLHHTDTLNIGHAQIIFKDVTPVEPPALAPQTVRSPVIVVPGNFGSALWRGSEQIWPNVHTLLTHPEKFEFSPNNPLEARGIVSDVVVIPKVVQVESYSRIGDYLQEALGYTRGQDLLEFAYDWRDDIRHAAQKLAETVEQWQPATPPVIIAHSLGCLVSRYYVDCLGGDRRVKKLFLMGGPHYGFPGALFMILPDNLSRFHTFVAAISGSLGQKMMDLFTSLPVVYQMLPIYPTLFDQHNQPLFPYEDGNWLPPDRQPFLAAGADFFQALNRQATIPTTCVFGYGTPTITRLNIKRDKQGRWQHVEMVSTSEGDGAVPIQSAILEGAEIHPVHQNHNQLYVDQDVLMRLNYELFKLGI